MEFLFFTLFQAEGRTTSRASARLSGIALKPIRGLASDLTRSQIEAELDLVLDLFRLTRFPADASEPEDAAAEEVSNSRLCLTVALRRSRIETQIPQTFKAQV